jgi:predicted DNA-binding ribbon-helix-helix protein
MGSQIRKHSVIIHGHKTSVSLEEPFWAELKSIAAKKNVTLQHLLTEIDGSRQHDNLSSALRLFVLASCLHSDDTVAEHQIPENNLRRA